ncbi:MAG: histidine--tRNA ligase, partial [Myxococcota bacterium]|nr:histidine--tRNA ligase [Myxococcota bacterium]
REVAAGFGYQEYDTCVLESEELYVRKAGDEITEQLYGFEDKGGRRVSLRPEMTPSLVRMLLSRRNSLQLPARWFSIPQCFRYEKMQKGRKREHFQWNMDILGMAGVAAEVELMSAQAAFLRAVGLRVDGDDPEISFKVSNRQVLEQFLGTLSIEGEAFERVCVIIDKRDKIGDEATARLLVETGVTDETASQILALLDVRGMDDLLAMVGDDNEGVQSLQALTTLGEAAGIGNVLQIDLSVVRGLSYYTGTVWELFDIHGAVPRAIAGGGRYDRLMESLGGTPTPMVGFGFGDVVIGLILEERGLLPDLSQRVDDVVYPMGEDQFSDATRLAQVLRDEGRRVLVDYRAKRFKQAIKLADEAGAERLLILGESEVAEGRVRVRSLGEDRQESDMPLPS